MIGFKSENKIFLLLVFLMAIVVTVSNYLVQFPFNHLGLDEILTYGAFTYPVAFLATDLANRKYGKMIAKKIVYLGFFLGVLLTLFFSTNFSDLISIRIAIGSGTAFITAQLIDVYIFDNSKNAHTWFDKERIDWLTERYSSPDITYYDSPVEVNNETNKIVVN